MLWQNDNDKRCLHAAYSQSVGKLGRGFLFSDGEETSTAGVVEIISGYTFTRENLKIKVGIFHLGK